MPLHGDRPAHTSSACPAPFCHLLPTASILWDLTHHLLPPLFLLCKCDPREMLSFLKQQRLLGIYYAPDSGPGAGNLFLDKVQMFPASKGLASTGKSPFTIKPGTPSIRGNTETCKARGGSFFLLKLPGFSPKATSPVTPVRLLNGKGGGHDLGHWKVEVTNGERLSSQSLTLQATSSCSSVSNTSKARADQFLLCSQATGWDSMTALPVQGPGP